MDDEILEKLLTKLIGLTEFGALKWHFAGDVSKAYVTVYRDSRLKLTDKAMDITELEGETVRLDCHLHQEPIPVLLDNLYKAAKESSSRFRTGAVKTLNPSTLASTCQKLLTDEEEIQLSNCLVCNTQFDLNHSYSHISHKEENGKAAYICQECVNKIGLAEAQARLEETIRKNDNSVDDDPITGDTRPLPEKSSEDKTTEQNRKNETQPL